MTWKDLAALFGFDNAETLASQCRRKSRLAFDNQGAEVINIMAPLVEPYDKRPIPLSESTSTVKIRLCLDS